jgi:hypothetical protein
VIDRRIEAELAEFLASDDRKRAELTFRLVQNLARENADTRDRTATLEKRVGRYSQRLASVEHIVIPNRIRAPEDSGHFELTELRDNRKFWMRLGITTSVGVLSALCIAAILALARYIATH